MDLIFDVFLEMGSDEYQIPPHLSGESSKT